MLQLRTTVHVTFIILETPVFYVIDINKINKGNHMMKTLLCSYYYIKIVSNYYFGMLKKTTKIVFFMLFWI